MTIARTNLPPMPPCPGYQRHRFGGDLRCQRCRRPRTTWSDYPVPLPGDREVLGRWLAGVLDDTGAVAELTGSRHEWRARELLDTWILTRDGAFEPDPFEVALWQTLDGRLYLRRDDDAALYAPFGASFEDDAARLALGDVSEHRPATVINQFWPWNGFSLVARWGKGSHLTPSSRFAYGAAPGPAACRYLGISGPEWLTTGEAAAALEVSPNHTRTLAARGLVVSRRRFRDLEFDPFSVATRAARRRQHHAQETSR